MRATMISPTAMREGKQISKEDPFRSTGVGSISHLLDYQKRGRLSLRRSPLY